MEAEANVLEWVGLFIGMALWAVVLVLLVLFVLSFFGWAFFAKTYRCAKRPEGGERYGWCSAVFGWFLWYNNCLTAVITAEGIFVEMPWLFRFCHPALLLPYRIVASVRKRKLLMRNVTEVDIRDGARRMKLYLPGHALDELSSRAAG